MVKASTKKSLRVAVFFKLPYYVDVLIFFLKISYCLLLLFCYSHKHPLPKCNHIQRPPDFPSKFWPSLPSGIHLLCSVTGNFSCPPASGPSFLPPTDHPVPESFFLKHKCDHLTVVQPMLTCRVTWKLHPYL